MSTYVDPQPVLGSAPALLSRWLAAAPAMPADVLAAMTQCGEFGQFMERMDAGGSNDAVAEAFYAYCVSEGLACLKVSHLVLMTAACVGANPQLKDRIAHAAAAALVCLSDIYSRAKSGQNPISGYVVPEIMPTSQIVAEYMRVFPDREPFADAFDEAIEENERAFSDCAADAELFTMMHDDPDSAQTYERWQDYVRCMGSSDTDSPREAYLAAVAKCADPMAYTAVKRSCLLRQISIRKCNALLREIGEGLAMAQPAGCAVTLRPVSTPARFHSPATRQYAARFAKPPIRDYSQ